MHKYLVSIEVIKDSLEWQASMSMNYLFIMIDLAKPIVRLARKLSALREVNNCYKYYIRSQIPGVGLACH